jgi:cAMP phosphodiesterase
LEIIHFDVCGQMMVPYLEKFVYYVLFIDDYSRNTWIYFLKEKDEVFNSFRNSRIWLKISSKGRLKFLYMIMEVSTPQRSLNNFANRKGLIGR